MAHLEKAPQKLSSVLRCPPGRIDVTSDLDPRSTPLYPGKGRVDARAAKAVVGNQLDDLQECLYANSKSESPHPPSVLLVLQGLDTAGKGGVIRHVIGMVDPQGVHIKAFKTPTPEERRHDFLWRIRKELPIPGQIGIFDRSHYEDVLIQRVDKYAPEDEIEARYGLINEFERQVVDSGTRIIKCFLNVSRSEQRKRIAARLHNPRKYWKHNPSDLDTRSKWDAYMEAYGLALERCNEEFAPWYVIPSDRKWYRNWAIAQLLLEILQSLNLEWPPATYDVAAELARLKQI